MVSVFISVKVRDLKEMILCLFYTFSWVPTMWWILCLILRNTKMSMTWCKLQIICFGFFSFFFSLKSWLPTACVTTLFRFRVNIMNLFWAGWEKKKISSRVSVKRLSSFCFLLVWYDFHWEVFVNKRLKPWESYRNAIYPGFWVLFSLKTKVYHIYFL